MFLVAYLCVNGLLAQSYVVDHLSGLKGKGDSQVKALLEDSRHYLWVGTAKGLQRFNGRHFQPLAPASLTNIQAMIEDRTGLLWIGTATGVYQYNGQQLQQLTFDQHVLDLLQDAKGVIWIATMRGLFTFQDDTIQAAQVLRSTSQIYQLFSDSQDRMWIASSDGLYLYSTNDFRKFTAADGITGQDIRAISEDHNGQIWIATYRKGLNVLVDEQFVRFAWSDLLEDKGGVKSLMHDSDGKMWVGTESNGLFVYDPGEDTYEWIQNVDGIGSNHVNTTLQDSWGNIWVATQGGGLSRCKKNQPPFLFFDKTTFFDNKAITALAVDTNNELWVGTEKGLYQQSATGFENYGSAQGFPEVPINALHPRAAQLWVATENNGLLIHTPPRFIRLSVDEGLGGNQIRQLLDDTLGQCWAMAYRGGVNRISSRTIDSTTITYPILKFNELQGVPNYITDAVLDEWQRLWIATADGRLAKFEKDSVSAIFTQADGLPGGAFTTLAIDTLGYLWGSSNSEGLFRINLYTDSLAIKRFDQTDGLTSDNITALYVDQHNNLWVAHPSGIDHIERNAKGAIKQLHFYGLEDQFIGRVLASNAITEDRGGRLWIGTTAGLYRHLPQIVAVDSLLPRPLFTNILVNGVPLKQMNKDAVLDSWGKVLRPLELSSLENDVLLEFDAAHLNTDIPLSFQWKLSGQWEEWLLPTSNSQITLNNLQAGDYTLAVRTIKPDNGYTSSAIELPIRIVPPFWETGWFRVAVALLVLLLIILLFSLRIRRIRAKAAAERQQLQLEKQLIQLEQKALALQMNPHFIFNALNSVQSQISSQNAKTARYQLAKFSRLMRRILENSRSIRIALSEEIALLEDYLSLEQFSRGNTFDFSIEMSPDLEPENTYIPPMMIQPFVENAIVHGLSGKREHGHISIRFKRAGNQLVCCIEDDGIGRTAAAARKSQQGQQHKSAALQVTRERLDLLAGKGEQASLKIVDLKDEEGQASGTQVWLNIPILQG